VDLSGEDSKIVDKYGMGEEIDRERLREEALRESEEE